MNESPSPLFWPEHFPPENRWDSFLMGIPALGPDLSFFKDLMQNQADRTEEVMAAWSDERERRVALSLGERLQKQWGWKKPYFIPADQMLAVVCGPDFWAYFESDLSDVFEEFNEQLGKRLKPEFWETLIDWNDKSVCFGELVHKLTAELLARADFAADTGET